MKTTVDFEPSLFPKQWRSQPDDLVRLDKIFVFIDCENIQFIKKYTDNLTRIMIT